MGSKAHLKDVESIARNFARNNEKEAYGVASSSGAASLGSSSRHWPRRRWDGSRIGPKRTRIRRLTVIPSDSNIRLTSRLRPSRSTTWYQRFEPLPPPEEMLS